MGLTKLSTAFGLCICLGLAIGCGDKDKEPAKLKRQIDNPKARAEAEEIAKVEWQLLAFEEPQWGVVLLTVVSQDGTRRQIKAEMPHSDWEQYMLLRGYEGRAIKFRYYAQGYREDMENRNTGDYLSPQPQP